MDNSKKIIILLICLGNISISFNTGAVAASIPLISENLGLTDFSVARLVPFYMLPYGVGGRLVGTYFGCSFFSSLVGMLFMGWLEWRWLFFIPAGLALITSISFYL